MPQVWQSAQSLDMSQSLYHEPDTAPTTLWFRQLKVTKDATHKDSTHKDSAVGRTVGVAGHVGEGDEVGHGAGLGLSDALLQRLDVLLVRVPRALRIAVAVASEIGRAARTIP